MRDRYTAYYEGKWVGEGNTEEECMTSAIAFIYEEYGGCAVSLSIKDKKVEIVKDGL